MSSRGCSWESTCWWNIAGVAISTKKLEEKGFKLTVSKIQEGGQSVMKQAVQTFWHEPSRSNFPQSGINAQRHRTHTSDCLVILYTEIASWIPYVSLVIPTSLEVFIAYIRVLPRHSTYFRIRLCVTIMHFLWNVREIPDLHFWQVVCLLHLYESSIDFACFKIDLILNPNFAANNISGLGEYQLHPFKTASTSKQLWDTGRLHVNKGRKAGWTQTLYSKR
jgi:hypothetical protein